MTSPHPVRGEQGGSKTTPLIFSGEMVRALLDGTKTQTRRILKPQPPEGWRPDHMDEIHKMVDGEFPLRNGGPIVIGWGALNDVGDWGITCPFGKPGDALWVRETWADVYRTYDGQCFTSPPDKACQHSIEYAATVKDGEHPPRWRSPIHMPRWASRLTLEIETVRVEQVQSISEADAVAEGCDAGWAVKEKVPAGRAGFGHLWRCIHGDESWTSNPFVWVLGFRVAASPLVAGRGAGQGGRDE